MRSASEAAGTTVKRLKNDGSGRSGQAWNLGRAPCSPRRPPTHVGRARSAAESSAGRQNVGFTGVPFVVNGRSTIPVARTASVQKMPPGRRQQAKSCSRAFLSWPGGAQRQTAFARRTFHPAAQSGAEHVLEIHEHSSFQVVSAMSISRTSAPKRCHSAAHGITNKALAPANSSGQHRARRRDLQLKVVVSRQGRERAGARKAQDVGHVPAQNAIGRCSVGVRQRD